MVLESKTHNIKKEERERERETLIRIAVTKKNKTCELCFVEFVSSHVNLNQN